MPKRTGTRRVESPEIQGDDSYVVVRKLKVAEMRKVIKEAGEDAPPEQQFERAAKLYADHIVEWNWVDDDGKPMPQLKDDPDVLDQLYDAELMFLGEALVGTAAERKNSNTGS